MILECPSCRARYMVPIGLFAQGGRQVRCARCKNEWKATLPTSIDVFIPLPTPVVSIPPTSDGIETQSWSTSPSVPMTDTRSSNSSPITDAMSSNLPAVVRKWNFGFFAKGEWGRKVLPYVAGSVLVAGLLTWPILDRQQIVKVLPGLHVIYDVVGLGIDHRNNGLSFEQVKSELRYDGGTMRLFVDGIIRNTTSDAQLIPNIKASALAPDKSIIQSWWVKAPAATVAAGSELPFHTEVNAAMKSTIEDVYLEFFAQDEKGDVVQ